MKTRNTQIFVAPGDDDAPLPIEPSPWHKGRWVRLPYEHWSVILEFAKTVDPVATGVVKRLSNLGAEQFPNHQEADLKLAHDFLGRLAILLPAAPRLVEAPTKKIPEDYPNEAHARMCDAVAAVMAAGVDAGQAIRSWVE